MKNVCFSFYGLLVVCFFFACKKEVRENPAPPPPTPVDTVVAIEPAVDPPLASTIGFFLAGWQGKTFTPPPYTDTLKPAQTNVIVNIDRSKILTKVPVSVFGNNTNPYMTQMVTEPVLINHIKNLSPQVIRFPGGNLSSLFFWNADKGKPPADAPEQLTEGDGKMIPAGYWYGNNNEGWTLSVDNYYTMLQQTGSEGMITINYGYARYGTSADPVAAAAHLAANWVRYDKGRTRYWEIGNESNGTWQAGYRIDVSKNKDGQPELITGELYGKHFKVFADSMRKAAAEISKTIYIGAQLLEKAPESWQTATDKGWNNGVFKEAGSQPDFYIIHSYYTPFAQNSSAAAILSSATTETAKMLNYVKQNMQAGGVPVKPVALTEWNIFAEGSMQQVSHINGLHASLVLGELIKAEYGMAARWNLANGWAGGNDHGMFNNGDEPGVPRWNPRPPFYHMYYFKRLVGDRLVNATVTGSSAINVYASSYSSGETGAIMINTGATSHNVAINIKNFKPGQRYYWYVLTGGADGGAFSRKVLVNGIGNNLESGGPLNYTTLKAYSAATVNGIKVTVPALSAVYLVVAH